MSVKTQKIVQMIEELENPDEIAEVGRAVARVTAREIRKRTKG